MAAILRPPGPGSALKGRRRAFLDTPAEFLFELQREFGDVVYFRIGFRDHYLLSHPDAVRDVLVTHHRRFHKDPQMGEGRQLVGQNLFTIEDETHRKHRKLIQPAFGVDRLKRYRTIMIDEATQLADAFRAGETRDMAVDMAAVTLGAAVKALFGMDMDEETRRGAQDFARAALDGMFTRTSARKATIASEDYQATLQAADALVDRMISERRENPGDRLDLLSMLIEATDETGVGLTDREVPDEIVALIVAGHETTANALTWTLYHLSQNPEAEENLHEELDRVLAGRAPVAEDVDRLPYTAAVFSESLRLTPTVWDIPRLAIEDHEVDGYVIPAGSVVLMSPYVIHRDPRWYSEPERFEPERWTSEDHRGIPRYAYVPFGAGVRMCIGQPFALMEATLMLATICQRWRLQLEPDHPVEMAAVMTLRPRYGMRMIPTPWRKDQVNGA
jgi:cytochrome P450